MQGKDYRKLMSAVLRQAIDDYIKMQHPARRRKKYEREAFASACSFFWNEEYLLAIEDGEGRLLDLDAVCKAAADRENLDVGALKSYLIQESVKYWDEKSVKTIEIPKSVVIEGHVYQVVQHLLPIRIDYDRKEINLNKKSPTVEEEFMQAMVELTCYHDDIKTSAKARRELGRSLYRLLRINNCFTGDFKKSQSESN